jgi:hypothetical protein
MSLVPLQPGDLVRCPKCGQFHEAKLADGVPSTEYANVMLYVWCGKDPYYVGQVGGSSRHEIQKRQ